MKHWEKSKKDHRRDDERPFTQESHKRKLCFIEKTKYRLRGVDEDTRRMKCAPHLKSRVRRGF